MMTIGAVLGVFDLLRFYANLVVVTFFIGFFLATLVAFVYNENRLVRQVYVGGFVTLLVATNLVLPTPAPFVKWHKFSDLRPDDLTRHEIRVVDASGNEIIYDNHATWGVDGISMKYAWEGMLNASTPEQREMMAQYLLREAQEHRARLRDRSSLHLLRFPPHGPSNTWVATELEPYDRFVGIAVYRIELQTSADGTEVTDYSEERLYEYVPNETMPTDATTHDRSDPFADMWRMDTRTQRFITDGNVPT